MQRDQLPISALPAWCQFNDVTFIDTTVQYLGSKGFGLVTEKDLNSQSAADEQPLLLIPHELILSTETIREHAKADHHFGQLLEVAGGQTLRSDILLFLLMQITISSPDHEKSIGLSNSWTDYVKTLPDDVPVPTMWNEEERAMLVATSLEPALSAKMVALVREFENLRKVTMEIPWCRKAWWEHQSLKLSNWLLVDAWYRSRCLELPHAGESLVPVLDMANHSSQPNAYYEQTPNNDVTLLLRPDVKLEPGSEITISYGESKSEAEMLFSYGFIDEQNTSNEIILTLSTLPDDPLGKAKFTVFNGSPVVRIFSEGPGHIEWESPFIYLACLNEEDGLEFKILQQTDGSQSQLRLFWQGSDVTEESANFRDFISHHDLEEIFRLRVTALLQDRIRQQLEKLYESDDEVQSLASVAKDRHKAALQLRMTETAILEAAYANVELQKNKLLECEKVLRYLGSAGGANEGEPDQNLTNEEEDFS